MPGQLIMQTILLRAFAVSLAAGLSALAGIMFVRYASAGGLVPLDLLRAALVVISGFWLVWGAAAALMGAFVSLRRPQFDARRKPIGMTAILVPVYNEDPLATFSRIAAMNRSLVELGIEDRFHFVVLSDTTSDEIAALEVIWFERLLAEPSGPGRIFYRRRERNVGKKAGNVEDFVRRSGGAYNYALILDADSLMEGATIGELSRRMDADPELGLLQTVPRIIHARTVFGRCMQFASTYLSPVFARGAALMQGNEGPYWGHNAIIRVPAFAASCGLPVLSGPPPYGGHILSHDYVEAALLSRAGWKVQVDPHLEGSFEEGPENLIEYAKRDRRWCQGNLQHRRLLLAPRLRFWSRFTFLQGIMAYLASPLWLALLAVSVLSVAFPGDPEPLRPYNLTAASIWPLAIGVVAVLLLPKLLILLRNTLDRRNRRFGGTPRVLLAVFAEIVLSTVLAPILLMFQARAVFQVLFGLDGGWPATSRESSALTVSEAFAASWWIVLIGVFVLGATAVLAPAIVVWVAPVMLPAVCAPVLIAVVSREAPPALDLFPADSERDPTPVVRTRAAITRDWVGPVSGLWTGQNHVHA
jgi:membrane glycosyltransferase